MEAELRVSVVETERYGRPVATYERANQIGNQNTHELLGKMLGDVIVCVSADRSINVLQALIARLSVLSDDSLQPFQELADCYLVWADRGEETSFSEFVKNVRKELTLN